jgi:ATP-dependent Clp protease protease subunit
MLIIFVLFCLLGISRSFLVPLGSNGYRISSSIAHDKLSKSKFGDLISRTLAMPALAASRHSSGDGQGAFPQSQSDNIPSWEIGPPPDLPSLLLSNRIIYIGMPLVPSVTELVIAQLLYLNYQSDQTITMYINSPGTNAPDGKAYSFDTEAFAIADTMQFIRAPIRTIAVGQAFGTAAMLVALGNKGNRFALPNSSIMLNQPRSRARGQASDVAIKAKEIANNRKVTNTFLARACGKDLATIEKDTERVKYMSPQEAVDYGVLDKILYPEELRAQAGPKFLEFL